MACMKGTLYLRAVFESYTRYPALNPLDDIRAAYASVMLPVEESRCSIRPGYQLSSHGVHDFLTEHAVRYMHVGNVLHGFTQLFMLMI